jgi:type I restriction-modification system DNA methylase subunit
MDKIDQAKENFGINFERIIELITKYEEIKKSGEIRKYNEESTKKDFIQPLFESLGWNFSNRGKSNDSVSAEETISKKRVDYAFRINGIPKFFLEAKSLKEDNIDRNSKYVIQAIDYAWMKSCSWAILTNFETIALYNADWKDPDYRNNRLFVLHSNDFLSDTSFTYLSKKAFEDGELDKVASKFGKKQLKNPINKQLLQDMIHFREILSKDIVRNNQDRHLTQDEVDESVQRILDRLIFIRNAEDRGLEENQLQSNVRQWHAKGKGHLIKEISRIYKDFDDKYNSKLFAHHLCDDLCIDNEALQEVTEGLNQSKDNSYRYDFSIIESDVLGNIYEQYLGNILKSTPKRAKLEESKTHRKEQGIYYTPSSIVDYIVKNTVGEFIKTHTPEEIRKVRILDPACGSGSFLIRAYKELEEYWSKYYERNKEISESARTVSQTKFNTEMDGNEIEFYSTKTEILKNNIFGVDLDPKAVEIAQLNLLLQISERKHRLPLLQNNIKVGNSLIDDPFISDRAFKWEEEFPEIMKDGGFDIVIGNPPYGADLTSKELDFLDNNYLTSSKKNYDTYPLFMERANSILLKDGYFSFIIPDTFLRKNDFLPFRNFLLSRFQIKKIFEVGHVFDDAKATENAIFIGLKSDRNDQDYFFQHLFLSKKRQRDLRLAMISNEDSDINNTVSYSTINSLENKDFRLFNGKQFLSLINKIEKFPTLGSKDILSISRGSEGGKNMISLSNSSGELKPILIPEDIWKFGYKYNGRYFPIKDPLNLKYKKPKIMVIRIRNDSLKDRIIATYDETGYFTLKTIQIINVKNDNKKELKFLLALLNSKLMNFYCTHRLSDDMNKAYLSALRIAYPTNETDLQTIDSTISKVDTLLEINKEVSEIGENVTDRLTELEQKDLKIKSEIDDLVYSLYGLTKKEITLLEHADEVI